MDKLQKRVSYYPEKIEQIWKLPFSRQKLRARRLMQYKDAIAKQYEAIR